MTAATDLRFARGLALGIPLGLVPWLLLFWLLWG